MRLLTMITTGKIKTASLLLFVMAASLSITGCSKLVVTTPEGQPQMTQHERNIASSKINTELGIAYMQRKDYPVAKQKLLLAQQQNPQSLTTLDALAYYSEITGNAQKAGAFYLKAIRVSPNSGKALNNYGAFLCSNGYYKQAEQYLTKAANEPTYIDTAAAFENAGLCALKMPNNRAAEYYFKRALQQDPTRPTSYYELANIYFNQGKYKLAKKEIDGYSSVGNPNPQALWLAIRIANKMQDTDTALKEAAVLKKKFPKSAEYKLYQKMPLTL